MKKNSIRQRDRRYFAREGGIIPEGYEMHHLWYSENYDRNSFVIVSHEEHMKYHGWESDVCRKGFDESAYRKDRYMKNIDYEKERGRQYYLDNAEKIKEKARQYKEEHKEEIAKQKKIYCDNRKDIKAAYDKERYDNMTEEEYKKILESQKKYYEAHKEEIKEKARRRYQIKKHREKLIKMGVI